MHAAVKCAYDQWSALLARVIREAQAAGEIGRNHDPDRLADVLVMLWEGATIRMQIDRSLQPVDDFLAFVFDSLLQGPELSPRHDSRAAVSACQTTGLRRTVSYLSIRRPLPMPAVPEPPP